VYSLSPFVFEAILDLSCPHGAQSFLNTPLTLGSVGSSQLRFFVNRVDAERPVRITIASQFFLDGVWLQDWSANTALDTSVSADSIEFDRHLEVLLASVKGSGAGAIARALGSHFHTQKDSVA